MTDIHIIPTLPAVEAELCRMERDESAGLPIDEIRYAEIEDRWCALFMRHIGLEPERSTAPTLMVRL